MQKESHEQIRRIFTTEMYYYGQPVGFSVNFKYLFPLFNVILVLLLVIVCCFFCWYVKDLRLLFPLVLMLVFAFNALMLYNVDALEDERHLFITQIMVELIGAVSLAFILEKGFDSIRSKSVAR
jgi:hypothetical protein